VRPGGLAGHSAALIGFSRHAAPVPASPTGLCPGPGICGDRGFGALPGHIQIRYIPSHNCQTPVGVPVHPARLRGWVGSDVSLPPLFNICGNILRDRLLFSNYKGYRTYIQQGKDDQPTDFERLRIRTAVRRLGLSGTGYRPHGRRIRQPRIHRPQLILPRREPQTRRRSTGVFGWARSLCNVRGLRRRC